MRYISIQMITNPSVPEIGTFHYTAILKQESVQSIPCCPLQWKRDVCSLFGCKVVILCSTVTATTEAAGTNPDTETSASNQNATGVLGPQAPTQDLVPTGDVVTESNETTMNDDESETPQGPAVTYGFPEATFASEVASQTVSSQDMLPTHVTSGEIAQPFGPTSHQPVLTSDMTSGDISQPYGPNLPPGGVPLPPGVTLPPVASLPPGGIPLLPGITLPPAGFPLPPGFPPVGVLPPDDALLVPDPADIFFNQIIGSLKSNNDTTDLVS